MNQDSRVVIVALVAALGLGGFLFWWKQQKPDPQPVAKPPTFAPPKPAPAPAPPPAPPAAPAIQNPIEPEPPAPKAGPLPGIEDSDGVVQQALSDILGRKAVQSLIVPTSLIRHFVATVDNLANERATTQLWPVNPTPGKFLPEPPGVISARNGDRYAPFVSAVIAVEPRRAVSVYRRFYPLFQQAYEELGYGGRYFNDRVVEVIDHLLATPEVVDPLAVKRVEVPGAAKPSNLYVFVDPALESRSAGQKLLLRMGRSNADRLKSKLREVRQLIVKR